MKIHKAMESNSNLEKVKFAFEIITVLTAFIGLIFAYSDSKRERREEAFRDLGDSYFEVLSLCMEYPHLDCYDIPSPNSPVKLSPEDSIRQKILYAVITNHLDQGYTLMNGRDGLWEGWDKYISRYLEREKFVSNWDEFKDTWGEEFRLYMEDKINTIQNKVDTTTMKEWLVQP